MKCPYCSAEDTRVIDSRPVEENNSIRRRRICDQCSRRFTTYEKIESIPMVVIKKDNNREPYDRSKIEGGIYDREDKEISSQEIGELVMNKIHDLDPVAYVRFASVYREFKDVETFMDELQKVLKTDRKTGRGREA